jgi:hypothetical protein
VGDLSAGEIMEGLFRRGEDDGDTVSLKIRSESSGKRKK